jgi:calcium-dependent protein kinase
MRALLRAVHSLALQVSVLRKLRGTLNVVHLEDVFEDDSHVHVVMELCHGGELLQKVATRHYSERTVR